MNNEFLQDKELSLEAKGLLATILTNKSDWSIHITELSDRSASSLHKHKQAYYELQKAGYLLSLKNGKVGWVIFASDRKFTEFGIKLCKDRMYLSTIHTES
ncbi:hypothetical protein NA32_06815 [Streptococcus hongkongensis]|nr:hypothetical protein NA32_06815 [Streptococcus hongkongensis]